MPRPLRIHVPGAFYHVTLRGNHRQNIFFGVRDREIMSSIVAEVIERFEARLHAYCYMTNHIHALIQVGDAPLGRLMLRIAGRYARTIQKGLRTTGHLFEKRYYPVLVDADEYLLQLLRYIHRNPVRANMVATVGDYPWSSHHAYIGARPEPFVHSDFALRLFGSDRVQAIAAYERFVNMHTSNEASPLQQRNPNDRRILGSDDFAAKLLGAAWRPRSRMSVEHFIDEACKRFSVTIEQLSSPSRVRRLVEARAWVAYQVARDRVGSIAEVARRFNRDESSLRASIKKYFDYP